MKNTEKACLVDYTAAKAYNQVQAYIDLFFGEIIEYLEDGEDFSGFDRETRLLIMGRVINAVHVAVTKLASLELTSALDAAESVHKMLGRTIGTTPPPPGWVIEIKGNTIESVFKNAKNTVNDIENDAYLLEVIGKTGPGDKFGLKSAVVKREG